MADPIGEYGAESKALWRALGGADAACALCLAAATVVVLGKDISQGALADADSAAHLMDGVLIHDWIMAGPRAWGDPMEFARTQYAHYPTLGIGQHYPPGFALVEAGFFAVFGIDESAARLCVLFFGVLMVVGAYFFVRAMAGWPAALLSGVVLLTLPATTLWGRQTMLEIPTMGALVWAAVAYLWYAARPGSGRLAIALVAAIATVLFKQTGMFLVVAVAGCNTFASLRRMLPWTHAAVACLAAAGTLAAVVWSFDDACFKTLSGYRTYPDSLSLAALSFYARATPYLTGSLILIPAVLGAALCLRRLNAPTVLLLCWVAASYAMVTCASLKVPRFFYLGVFPLAVWAAIGTDRLLALIPWPRLRYSAVGLGVAILCSAGFLRPVRGAPDYAHVVAAHRGDLEGQAVLFSGLRDGDFVFQARRQLPWRAPIIVRGSKLLYTCTSGQGLDHVSYVSDQEEVGEVMRRYAFEAVIVERENVVGTIEDDWLRDYLATSGDYYLAARHDLGVACRSLPSTVDVYRLRRPLERTVEYFDIPMPRTGTPIRVSLNGTDRPKGSS